MNHLKRKYNSNEVIVNNKSNFKSQLVKCQSIMDNTRFDDLVIRAMGKATCRAMNLALQLNLNNYETFELKPKTFSVELKEDNLKRPVRGADKDGFDPKSVDVTGKKTYFVPAIEIVVRKSEIEIERVKQIKRQSEKNS